VKLDGIEFIQFLSQQNYKKLHNTSIFFHNFFSVRLLCKYLTRTMLVLKTETDLICMSNKLIINSTKGGALLKDREKASSKTVKHNNKQLVLSTVLHHGPLSRADISRITGLTRSTVSQIVNELIEEDLVEETSQKEESKGPGRRGILLKGNSQKFFVIGYDVGTLTSRVILLNINGRVVKKISFPTLRDKERLLNQIKEAIYKIIELSSKDIRFVRAIGMAFPGLVNDREGFVAFSPNLKSFFDVSIRNFLEQEFGVPVVIENNTKVMALAEKRFGKAKKASNIIVLNLGPGIGAGIVVNNELVRGKSSFAGEIGHIPVLDNGDMCSCGNRGCLESVASTKAIVRQYNKYSESKIDDLFNSEAVANRAKNGDEIALKVLKEAGKYIGKAIAICVNLFNPEMVVVSGGLSKSWDLIKQEIVDSYHQYVLKAPERDVEITVSNLGDELTAIGSAYLALNKVLYGMKSRP